MFYFTFGVTVIAVRSVVLLLINDNDYDMMMNMKRMNHDEDDYDDEGMIVEVY